MKKLKYMAKAYATWAMKKTPLASIARRYFPLAGDPREIAAGMALGVFVSFTPTIPFHTLLAILLALIFRASKSAAALGVWIGNPVFTVPFYYYISYRLGCLALGTDPVCGIIPQSIVALLRLGGQTMWVMLVGGGLLGLIPAGLAFLLTYHVAKRVVIPVKTSSRIRRRSS